MNGEVRWVKRYEVNSLQIYFSASLELQGELVNNGFQVPSSRDGRVKTPIPIIYSNFRGWLGKPNPITIERLIPPEWLRLDPSSLGWEKTTFRGKTAFYIPLEEVYVDVGYEENGNIHLKLDVRGYHLERTSIRGVNPEKWTNWVMFYVNADLIEELLNLLKDIVKPGILASRSLKVEREIQQGGKEVTYYAYIGDMRDVGIPVRYFSFCMGCFHRVLDYLRIKARENGLNESIVDRLRLRIEFDPTVRTGVKVGVAKIAGKRPQVMFKLASNTPKSIKGILKPRIEGKARGKLVECNHESRNQYMVVNGELLYYALEATKTYLQKLPIGVEG